MLIKVISKMASLRETDLSNFSLSWKDLDDLENAVRDVFQKIELLQGQNYQSQKITRYINLFQASFEVLRAES